MAQTLSHNDELVKWKADHYAAMKVYDLQDWIRTGNKIFDGLVASMEKLRAMIYAGEYDFENPAYKSHLPCFALWHFVASSSTLENEIRKLTEACGNVEGVTELRSRVDRAKSIIENWVDPASVPALAMRRWELTPKEAMEIQKFDLPGK